MVGGGVGRFDGFLADVFAAAAVLRQVADAEAALGLGEVAQRLLVGGVPFLGKRLEEVDHLDRRVVVGGGLHQLVAGGGILDRLEVRCGATGGVLSNASGHVR